jgi:hypothetical protein
VLALGAIPLVSTMANEQICERWRKMEQENNSPLIRSFSGRVVLQIQILVSRKVDESLSLMVTPKRGVCERR